MQTKETSESEARRRSTRDQILSIIESKNQQKSHFQRRQQIESKLFKFSNPILKFVSSEIELPASF